MSSSLPVRKFAKARFTAKTSNDLAPAHERISFALPVRASEQKVRKPNEKPVENPLTASQPSTSNERKRDDGDDDPESLPAKKQATATSAPSASSPFYPYNHAKLTEEAEKLLQASRECGEDVEAVMERVKRVVDDFKVLANGKLKLSRATKQYLVYKEIIRLTEELRDGKAVE